MKKAFTLAEIMIVLSVIAILTAILLPSARNAMPNEDLMKFKKSHLLLINTIQELVNSDKYYSDGMLDTKANGQGVDSPTYFCETFADVVGNVKSLNCKDDTHPSTIVGYHYNAQWDETGGGTIWDSMTYGDIVCREQAPIAKDEIVLSNGASYYMINPGNYFGIIHPTALSSAFRLYKTGSYIADSIHFYAVYKIFCMDIDGTPENATSTDCVNECPFGYGLRVDGKIHFARRASDWFKKTLQEK